MTDKPTTFLDLNLSEPLLKALTDLKFQTPSPIQAETIPWLLQQRDMIALAQTGTGKTAAFALPILQNLNVHVKGPQALILAPTRELAIQVAAQFEAFSRYQPGIRVTVLCGGQDYRPQLKSLRDGAHIVVGTPGRVLDHIDRHTLVLDDIRTFVLDEADEMLRMGFIEDVEHVLTRLPTSRQIALFSATMPTRIRQIATQYLQDPISVEIRSETATVKTTEQRFLFVSQPQKADALLRVLAVEESQGVIVFVRTKSSAEEVAERLIQQGHRAMAIHGDLTQSLRERIITQFKQGAIDILVATDVAARGLDVDRVTHVVNYDMAHDCETYVHRIGRTGRAGRSGVTILFVTPRESRMLTMLERHTRQRIEKVTIPNDHMIQVAREQRLMTKISERLTHEHVSAYRRIVEHYLQQHPDHQAVDVAAALGLLLHQDKPWQQSLPAMPKTAARPEREGRSSRPARFSDGPKNTDRRGPGAGERATEGRRSFKEDYPQMAFRIDVGRIHGVKPGNIVGAIANEAGIQSRYITGLKIHDEYSTVRLPKHMDKNIMRELNKAWVCGRQLNLTPLDVAS